MDRLKTKLKRYLIFKLIKEDDENHLLFLYNKHPQINKFLTMGQVSSGIFHDLFTPISSMSLIIDHLNKTGAIKDNVLNKLLINSKDDLNNLIKTIQNYLRDKNKVEKVNSSEIIEQSIRLLSHKIKESSISLSFLRKENIYIKTNKLKLLQVIINILHNSINSFEYLDRERKIISISSCVKNNILEITISDNGSGIPRRILKKIYSPMFTTRDSGIGLGLYTTKNIIENELSGKIKISSKEDKGTKTKIKIPIK